MRRAGALEEFAGGGSRSHVATYSVCAGACNLLYDWHYVNMTNVTIFKIHN